MSEPRLRGGKPRRSGPYPLGQIPNKALLAIGKQIVHRLAIGVGDIEGNDFGTIFAGAIEGIHRASPLGLADVETNGCAWSVKTVKASKPFKQRKVRLISGRNSPDYSLGIKDPHADISATGRAVLSIWNARVDEALDEYEDLRIIVLIRNIETREFTLFEEETQRFIPDNYEWSYTKKDNLRGLDKITKNQRFTWQFSGSQFTIFRDVPGSARKFSIGPDVPTIDPSIILNQIQFQEDWVKFHD